MITVNSLNDKRFTLNGVEYFRNYVTKIAGSKLIIYNVYDNKDVLVPLAEYDQFSVNGTIYNSAEDLQSAIMGICYNRSTLGGDDSPLNQNNIGKTVNIGGFFSSPNSPVQDAVAKINNQVTFIVKEINAPVVLYGIKWETPESFEGPGTPPVIATKKYSFLFLEGKGTYGNGATQINANSLYMLPTENLTVEAVENQPGVTIISLGDLPNGDYLTAANSTQRDFSDAGQLDENGNIITYYFSYTRNETLYFVQFIGSPGVYQGNLEENDLVSTTNSDIEEDYYLNNIVQYRDFGELSGTGEITSSQVAAHVNSLSYSFVVSAINTPVLFAYNRAGKRYTFLFTRGKGIWGAANGSNPNSSATVNATHFKLLSVFNIVTDDIQNSPGATIINLGEVSDGNYLAAANSEERDFSDSGQLDSNNNVVTYYFSYTVDETLYFVQFVGAAGVYNGNLTENDLVASTNSNLQPDITLQQVTDSGNVTTNNIEVNGITVNDAASSNVLLLSGTEPGNLITGDIEFENTLLEGTRKIFANAIDGTLVNQTKYIEFWDEDAFIIGNIDNLTGTVAKLSLYPNSLIFNIEDNYLNAFNMTDGGLYYGSNNPDSRGISGSQDFTANITELDYVQKKYIDDIPFIELHENSPKIINKVWAGTLAEYETLPLEDTETLYLKEGVKETGWGTYSDTQYNSAGPFSLMSNTETIVPNNSNSVVEAQLPSDIISFTEVVNSATSGLGYDHSKIIGNENDILLLNINLKVVPTESAATYIEIWLNNGSGEENKNIFTFPKGEGEIRQINFPVSAIISSEWNASGASLHAKSNGNCDIYDISWSVSRIHKAL